MIGEKISHYRILGKLGAGGMGEVFLAEDAVLGRKIALKFVLEKAHLDSRGRERFFNEARSAAALDHPFICKIYETGEAEGRSFIAMEYVSGVSLKDKLAAGPIPVREALQIATEVAEALQEAHRQRIIHRDLKPSNVMLSPQGHVKVLDFGLAKVLRAGDVLPDSKEPTTVTEPGVAVGTLGYMSPEQLRGRSVDARTDIFSLGVLLYEMLAGANPFRRPSAVETSAAVINEEPPPVTSPGEPVPAALQHVVRKTLVKDPSARCSSAQELLVDLRAILAAGAKPAEPPRHSLSRSLRVILPTIVVLIAITAWLVPWRRFGTVEAVVPEGSYALLADVENHTGDAQLNVVVLPVLENQLRQSAYLNLVDHSRVREVLQRMLVSPDKVLDLPTAREVAWRDGIPLVISGSLAQLGDAYLLNIRLDRTGDRPDAPANSWSQTFQTGTRGKEGILKEIDAASGWIRKMAGEAARDLAQRDVPAREATTASWEALSLFSEAERFKSQAKLDEAVIQLKQAVGIDPEFALAYSRLGDILFGMRRQGEGFRYYKRALSAMARGRLTRREEMSIRAIYAFDSGDYEGAEKLFHAYSLAFPNDSYPLILHALTLKDENREEEAIPLLLEASQKSPSNYVSPVHLAMTYMILGRFEQCAQQIGLLRSLGQAQWAESLQGDLEFVRRQYKQAEDRFSALARSGSVTWRSRGIGLLASLLAEEGRYQEALVLLSEGIDFDRRTSQDAERADKHLAAAYIQLRINDRNGVKNSCLSALSLDQSPSRLQNAGALLARAGFVEEAEKLINDLEPETEAPIFAIARHRIAGEALEARKKPREALVQFELASKLESPTSNREYLARALKLNGDTAGALQWYRRVVDSEARVWHYADKTHPGLWADCLFQWLSLANSLNVQEDLEREARRYLDLRDHADATVIEVQQARAFARRAD